MAIKVKVSVCTKGKHVTDWLHEHVGERLSSHVFWAGTGWKYEWYYEYDVPVHVVWFHDLVDTDVITQFVLTWS